MYSLTDCDNESKDDIPKCKKCINDNNANGCDEIGNFSGGTTDPDYDKLTTF